MSKNGVGILLTEDEGHGKRWGMRILILVLSLLASYSSFANQPIYGVIARDATKLSIVTNNTQCSNYIISTKSRDASAAVKKLSNGDSLTATGLLNPQDCTALIESIEFVGLKKMLGKWYSPEGIIDVRNFNSLSYYPVSINIPRYGYATISSVQPIDYRYSITPTDGKEWVLFLSDRTSTTFATIKFERGNVIMKLYDSETGEVTKTLFLSRWSNLK